VGETGYGPARGRLRGGRTQGGSMGLRTRVDFEIERGQTVLSRKLSLCSSAPTCSMLLLFHTATAPATPFTSRLPHYSRGAAGFSCVAVLAVCTRTVHSFRDQGTQRWGSAPGLRRGKGGGREDGRGWRGNEGGGVNHEPSKLEEEGKRRRSDATLGTKPWGEGRDAHTETDETGRARHTGTEHDALTHADHKNALH